MRKEYPVPTDKDKQQVLDRLPRVKKNLVDDLKAMGWKEKWIRHLIWFLRRQGEIYQFYGIIRKTGDGPLPIRNLGDEKRK